MGYTRRIYIYSESKEIFQHFVIFSPVFLDTYTVILYTICRDWLVSDIQGFISWIEAYTLHIFSSNQSLSSSILSDKPSSTASNLGSRSAVMVSSSVNVPAVLGLNSQCDTNAYIGVNEVSPITAPPAASFSSQMRADPSMHSAQAGGARKQTKI